MRSKHSKGYLYLQDAGIGMKIILVIAYLSATGVPKIDTQEMQSMSECRSMATQVFARVKAGTVRAWCAKVRG